VSQPATALRGVLRRLSRHRLGDVLLVLVVVAVSVGHTRWGGEGSPSTTTYLLDVALPLPLLVRRTQPLTAFAAVSGLALLEWALGTPADSSFAVLLGLYAVGVHASARRSVAVAAGIAQVGVVLAALRWAPPGQALTAMLLLTGTVTAAWVLGVYVRTRRAYLASVLERAVTAERDRDRQALLAAAQERTRIARELHDIVAHSVSVMIALSDGAAATAERDPGAARNASEQASATGRQALTEMHRLLGVLRDDTDASLTPQPGIADIAQLLEPMRAAGINVHLLETGSPAALPASAQLALYRLLQESLTNILKHGRSVTQVTVTLRYGPDYADIDIDDNGTSTSPGIPEQPPTTATGHGLIGMRERLAAFDGHLHAGRDGHGWHVHGHLPLQPLQPATAGNHDDDNAVSPAGAVST
jgi:signal transduction histidine kinase